MSIYDYDPDQKPKTSKEERDRLMKKFLEKGGKVQKLEPGYPTNVGSLDKSKKPAFTREDIKEGKQVMPLNLIMIHIKKDHITTLMSVAIIHLDGKNNLRTTWQENEKEENIYTCKSTCD